LLSSISRLLLQKNREPLTLPLSPCLPAGIGEEMRGTIEIYRIKSLVSI